MGFMNVSNVIFQPIKENMFNVNVRIEVNTAILLFVATFAKDSFGWQLSDG